MKKVYIPVLALLTAVCALNYAQSKPPTNEVVSWQAPVPNDATGYVIYWSTTPTAPKPWPVLGTTSGLSLTNMTAGRFYYYGVATNQFGESDPTDVAFRPGNPGGIKVKP